MTLSLTNIAIAYQHNTVVQDVSFSLSAGEIGCLLGPSGCGKTSIIRAIAGFEQLQSGEISLRGKVVSGEGIAVPPEKRHTSVVFQDFALFPHLTIGQNIAFGLHGEKEPARQQRVSEMLRLVGLSDLEQRYPYQLSGGQQQRVALARALATNPDVLLLDEPFSSLDAELREELAKDIRRILKHENTTALMVTHDQHEAFAMADKIGVMRAGVLHQWSNAYDLYHTPASRFVADFIGNGVFLDGVVIEQHKVETVLGQFSLPLTSPFNDGDKVEILIRPDDILHDDDSLSKAEVVSRLFRGAHILYELKLAGEKVEHLLCLAPSHHDHKVGEKIGIRLDMEHLIVFSVEQ